MNRRQFLGATMVTSGMALSGCIGESEATSLEQAPESALKMSVTKDTASEQVMEGSGHLEEGEFAGNNFWAKTGFRLEWELEVTEGGPIDVWVMTQDQLKPFSKQGEVSYFRGVSKSEVKSGKASGVMQPDKDMIIFENSGAFKTEPKGPVDFDATIRMSFQ